LPNTLAHIGINGLLTKTIAKKSDILWIYLGCLIPDFPWIVRKIVALLLPNINGYELQPYVIVQASLFFCIILSLSFVSLSRKPTKTFFILFWGALLHLLLDPMQTKWANGVHLFAPINWKLLNYGFFWPESYLTYFITISGILFFVFTWKELLTTNFNLVFSKTRIFWGILFLGVYLFLPLKFMDNVLEADNHFVGTLKDFESRKNKYVEMDRKEIEFNENTNSYWVKSFNDDEIELANVNKISSTKLSIKGNFVTNNKIWVTEYHENWVIFRDGASYIGLALILFAWIYSMKDNIRKLLYNK